MHLGLDCQLFIGSHPVNYLSCTGAVCIVTVPVWTGTVTDWSISVCLSATVPVWTVVVYACQVSIEWCQVSIEYSMSGVYRVMSDVYRVMSGVYRVISGVISSYVRCLSSDIRICQLPVFVSCSHICEGSWAQPLVVNRSWPCCQV